MVSIDREGRWYLNVGDHKTAPIEEAALSDGVRVVLGRDAQTPVLLKADQSVPYGTVVRTMVLLQHAGATRIGFLTDPPNTRAVGSPARN